MAGIKVNPNVRMINKEELFHKLKKDEDIQVVNVLSPEHYELGSIKGSKKIPYDEIDSRVSELDKNKEVVTYCTGINSWTSLQAAQKLETHGFYASAYEGGINEWSQAGLPRDEF